MNMATWYEVCAVAGEVQIDNTACGTLDQAKAAIQRFQVLYPELTTTLRGMIFVRQHIRGGHKYRVMHKLTVGL